MVLPSNLWSRIPHYLTPGSHSASFGIYQSIVKSTKIVCGATPTKNPRLPGDGGWFRPIRPHVTQLVTQALVLGVVATNRVPGSVFGFPGVRGPPSVWDLVPVLSTKNLGDGNNRAGWSAVPAGGDSGGEC